MESRGHCVGVSGSVQSSGRSWRNKICVPGRKDTDTYPNLGKRPKNVDELCVLHGLNGMHAT